MTKFPRTCCALLAVQVMSFGQITPPAFWPTTGALTPFSAPSATTLPAAAPPVATPAATQKPSPIAPEPSSASRLTLGLNKSIVIDEPAGILRIAVSNGDIAEAVAVSANEAMVNGKAPGVTSLIVWLNDGSRKVFDLAVEPGSETLGAVQAALSHELAGQDIHLSIHAGSVFLTGLARDLESADRAVQIATVLGKVVNLLQVKVRDGEPQILLRVRFANVDRGATSNLGINLFSTPNPKMLGATTTGQFGVQPAYDFTQNPPTTTLNNLLNIFLYRPDINLGAVVSALEAKNLAQVLAEPNLLTLSGHPASFLAGGQFPYPTIQGGQNGIGQVTIQFRDFGIRLHFLPRVTLRGTIQLEVEPEVSALDPANGLVMNGYTIPGLDIRRVHTEVELRNGQSLVIAGLLDDRVTQTINKIPGLSAIPLFGKLFESRAILKNNSELLVIVTPEIVEPIPAGTAPPSLDMPQPFLSLPSAFPARLDPAASNPAALSPAGSAAAKTDPSGHVAPSAANPAVPDLPLYVPVEQLRTALDLEGVSMKPAAAESKSGLGIAPLSVPAPAPATEAPRP